jgi:hypothetical protein
VLPLLLLLLGLVEEPLQQPQAGTRSYHKTGGGIWQAALPSSFGAPAAVEGWLLLPGLLLPMPATYLL